jgi:hypothetical protein
MSDYFCVCEPMEGEPWSVVTEGHRRARKVHKCCECGEAIPKGETHHYFAGVCDGEFVDYRTCLFCEAERDRITIEHDWPVTYGDLACCLVAELRGEL